MTKRRIPKKPARAPVEQVNEREPDPVCDKCGLGKPVDGVAYSQNLVLLMVTEPVTRFLCARCWTKHWMNGDGGSSRITGVAVIPNHESLPS